MLPSKVKLAIYAVYTIVLVDMFGTMMVIPVYTAFCKQLGASTANLGFASTITFAASFLSSLYMGPLSDMYGRRLVFCIAGLGACITFAGSASSTTFEEFLIWRFLAGLCTGTVGNAYAYIADVVPSSMKSTYISYVTAVMSSCVVIGPMIGGGLSSFGLLMPFHVATFSAFVGVLVTYLFVIEPRDLLASVREQVESGQAPNDRTYLLAKEKSVMTARESKSDSNSPFSDPKAVLVGCSSFLYAAAFSALTTLIPILLMEPEYGIVTQQHHHRRLQDNETPGLTPTSSSTTADDYTHVAIVYGYLLGLVGIIQTALMIFGFPYMSKTYGVLTCASTGSLLFGSAILSVAYITDAHQLFPIYAMIAVANSFIRPSFPAYLSSIAPKGMNAAYVSLAATFSSLAMMMGALFTQIYGHYKLGAFYIAAALSFTNAILLFILEMCQDKPPKPALTPLEVFMGTREGLPEGEFYRLLQSEIRRKLESANWGEMLKAAKGQATLKSLLLQNIPDIPKDEEEKWEKIYTLYMETGHEEWADELSNYVDCLHYHHHSQHLHREGSNTFSIRSAV